MPSRYRHDTPRLKAEIVARADAGETLRAICALPGMPGVHTVRNWAKADPLFAEALAVARRRGTWRRLWGFDEAKAAAFLARARAGERIHDLLREPGMPSRGTYDRWRTAQPPFAEAAFALLQRRNAQLRERGRAGRRAFDQALADRIIVRLNQGAPLEEVLTSDPELPCWETMMRWRREEPEFDRVLRMIMAARRRAVKPVPEPVVEAVVEHIILGGSFLSFTRLPGAPSYGTLRRWMRDPKFAAAVAAACEDREEWYHDQILMASERDAPGSIRERERAVGRLKRQLVRLRRRPRKALGFYERRPRPPPEAVEAAPDLRLGPDGFAVRQAGGRDLGVLEPGQGAGEGGGFPPAPRR
jgi:hypothetical protein